MATDELVLIEHLLFIRHFLKNFYSLAVKKELGVL